MSEEEKVTEKLEEFKIETKIGIEEGYRKEFEHEMDILKTNMKNIIDDAKACNYQRMIDFTDPYTRTKERIRNIVGSVRMLDFANNVEHNFKKLVANTLKKECECK